MCPARILVADDHEVVRHGLRSLIGEHPEWELVAEAANGREAVAKASEMKPDVAILDIGMPSLNGLDATKQILKIDQQAKILILTMHDSEHIIANAVNAGARGYVLKAEISTNLVRAVNALLNGQTYFTQKAGRLILDWFTGKGPKSAERDSQSLTAAERELLQLLVRGKTIKEAAALLRLSTRVVQTHRKRLIREFKCRDGNELVRYALRNRLIDA